jgi:hypothetical protein
MVILKQYLENSWYRWASQDRQTWYASQYQYWYWVNTRNMKNWVCLAWWQTDVTTKTSPFTYFTCWSELYYVDAAGKIYDVEWTQKCDTWVQQYTAPSWIEFWNSIYIVWQWGVVKVNPTTWTYTNMTSDFPTYYGAWYRLASTNVVLNYANTFLLIWNGNVLWRISTETWTEVIKGIRFFDLSYTIFWLTQEWNYLKIYVSNWINSKIHYAKGTFDVEYTWLVQTVSLKWLALNNWQVASDQWYDYAIFTVQDWEYKLSKIQWYSKVDIKWTETWWWEKVFTADSPNIKSADGVLFAAMKDWIRTFTEYNGWLWWGCCEFPLASNEKVTNMFKFWEYLYTCVYNSSTNRYSERYFDMSFHPAKYQRNWYIIGRVFDWGCAGLFKKNDQATITYNMPTDTSMELSYRYDRSSFWYDKSNFLLIKKLEDTKECYDIVVPTTPSKTEISLLSKQSWINDLILLENGNWIQLEDMLVIPFNKTWNLLEYRFDLATNDNAKTPILFEHSLTYYDYMRKYR